jgi:hypothetical protein
MTNHHDEMRVAPDPSRAEELRQRLHARLASGRGDEPVVPIQGVPASTPSVDTDPDHREGDIIMLDTEDHPTGSEPVTSDRRSPGKWLLVAAAVAVVAVVGTLFVAAGGDDEDPVDTVSPPPTAAAPSPAPAQDLSEVFANSSEAFPDLEPGVYFIDPDGDDTTPLRVTYQVEAEDWSAWFGALKSTGPGVTSLTITTLNNLVSDGCLDFNPLEPPVGPTVDDLATALSQLAPFEVTAPPSDVTLFGYPGKHLELTVPDSGLAGCVDGELHSWISPLNDNGATSFSGYNGPGETEEFWILDVDGTRLVLVKWDSPQTSAEDIAERDAIFDSIRIDP